MHQLSNYDLVWVVQHVMMYRGAVRKQHMASSGRSQRVAPFVLRRDNVHILGEGAADLNLSCSDPLIC